MKALLRKRPDQRWYAQTMQDQEFASLLEAMRDGYIAHLIEIARLQRSEKAEIVTELALRLNGESADERLLLVRVDMAWKENEEACLANAELNPLGGQDASVPASFVHDEYVVTVLPFRWHACLVTLRPAPQFWEPIWSWFEHWFDVEETRPPDPDGLTGVVHRLSLHQGREACQIEIDFGSAPVAAVVGLLNACAAAGSASVRLADAVGPETT